MDIFWITAFLVKHYLGDYVFQTKEMVDEKPIFLSKLGLLHAGIHGGLSFLVICLGIVCCGSSGQSWFLLAALIGILDFVTHYAIDLVKAVYMPVSLTPETQMHWVFFGLDQLLHQLTYVGFIVYILS